MRFFTLKNDEKLTYRDKIGKLFGTEAMRTSKTYQPGFALDIIAIAETQGHVLEEIRVRD